MRNPGPLCVVILVMLRTLRFFSAVSAKLISSWSRLKTCAGAGESETIRHGPLPTLLFRTVDDIYLLLFSKFDKVSAVAGYSNEQISVFLWLFHCFS